MQTINLLKKALDIFIILLIITKIYMLSIVILYYLYPELTFFDHLTFFETIGDQPVGENSSARGLLGFIDSIASILFLFAIWKFKKFISAIKKEKLFSSKQEKASKNFGLILLIYAIFNWIPLRIYKDFIEKSPKTVNYGIGDSESFWFAIILGLFFIFLSKAFQNARNYREENDLTI